MNTLNGSLLPPTLQSTLSREGWKATTIGDLCITIRGGGTPSKRVPEYWTGNVPWATVKDLSNFDPFSTQDYISESGVQESATRIVEAGTLIISVRMLVARAVQFSIDVAINQDLKALELKDGVSPAFLRYWFNFRESYLANSASGSTVKGISTNSILGQEIYLPPRKEQEFIADSLTDADQLISSLERLISKKQAIKQGMMQELLTGRTRLPGFNRPWHEKLLGDLTRIKTGSRNNQDKVSSGAYPFFVRSQTVERIDTYSYSGEAVLIPGEGGIGEIFHYINGCHEVHQRVYRISDFSGISGKFAFYYLQQFFKDHALRNTVKATVDSIRLPIIQSFKMAIPGSIVEQTAIAALLDDTSSEIDTLERRLESARNIKQGMMQELLTGRTRLPVEEVSS